MQQSEINVIAHQENKTLQHIRNLNTPPTTITSENRAMK